MRPDPPRWFQGHGASSRSLRPDPPRWLQGHGAASWQDISSWWAEALASSWAWARLATATASFLRATASLLRALLTDLVVRQLSSDRVGMNFLWKLTHYDKKWVPPHLLKPSIVPRSWHASFDSMELSGGDYCHSNRAPVDRLRQQIVGFIKKKCSTF